MRNLRVTFASHVPETRWLRPGKRRGFWHHLNRAHRGCHATPLKPHPALAPDPTSPSPPATMASNLLRLSRPRTIACIGRNYADHIAELGNTRPTEPFYFLKPATTILQPKAGPILAPKNSNLHYEVELAAVIGSTVEELPNSKEALKAVKGWAVGIDMTARNCRPPIMEF